MRLELEKITIDPSLQIRVETNSPTIAEYEERMSEGEQFPALLVWFTDGVHILLDGWHRHQAMTNCGFVDCECKVFTGTKAEALIAAAISNRTHGLPMSRADKRKAIQRLVEACGELSSRAIGDAVGVTHNMVEAVRNELGNLTSSRTGKDGKKRETAIKREKRGENEDTSDRDDEPTEPPPDPGIGGDALSPETISNDEPKAMTKGEAVETIDICIACLLADGSDAMAAQMMRVKAWAKGVRG